jgi:predicted nucleotide-binding protein (sugar kinase/HSP70/actin superfamily)
MIIERNSKEIIIRIPASVSTEDLQDFIDYTRYKELTSNSKATQEEIDKLAQKVNKDWWTENRKRFVK